MRWLLPVLLLTACSPTIDPMPESLDFCTVLKDSDVTDKDLRQQPQRSDDSCTYLFANEEQQLTVVVSQRAAQPPDEEPTCIDEAEIRCEMVVEDRVAQVVVVGLSTRPLGGEVTDHDRSRLKRTTKELADRIKGRLPK